MAVPSPANEGKGGSRKRSLTAGQPQWLAFQMYTLAADEMRVSGHLGSLPNSGEQHVPPGAFCIFPSVFSPVLFFPGP